MIRRWFELLGSRWLLAPLFVVLIASLLALLVSSIPSFSSEAESLGEGGVLA